MKEQNIKFISDLHLGHSNCLGFDNRPFKDIGEQDEMIIKRWNESVSKDDVVWILGDISWYSPTKTAEIFNQLNGTKNLCVGNHDKKLIKNYKVRSLFKEVVDYKEMKINNTDVILCHYLMPCFNKHFYGSYHLYGHVHSGFEWNMMEKVKSDMESLYDKKCNMYNVGCMMPYIDYSPKTLLEIAEFNTNNKFKREV